MYLSHSKALSKYHFLKLNIEKLPQVIALLYIAEIILGFNGKLILVGGLSIRWILFALLFVILVIKSNHEFQKNKKYKLDTFDYTLALFLLVNLVWVFIVPYYSGYSIKMAIKEVLSFSILLLYFPLTILINRKVINWPTYQRAVKYCLFVLACIHILLYIGEKMSPDSSFSLSFFKLIEKITLGNSQRPLVMMPYFCVRIIYPCSIFFIVMFYFIIKDNFAKKNMFYYIITLTALYTPLTKSLWFGVAVSMIFFLVYSILICRKRPNMIALKKIFILLSITLISTTFLNYVLFDNYIFIRLSSSFQVPLSQPRSAAEIMNLDEIIPKAEEESYGTQRANYTRIDQTKKLLSKWKESPIIGFGYGSYVDDYLRASEDAPYSYEMLLPSLLMKIGILGLLIWAVFIFYIFRYTLSKLGWQNKNALSILYIIVALGIASQFNPYLFNSSGMSIILFCLIEIKYHITCKNESTPLTDQSVYAKIE